MCYGSSETTVINGCPVSQQVWHAKDPSLLNGRAVTTIEADEAAASSDFLQKKNEREREGERKKMSKRQDIDFCSSKGYIFDM